MASVTTNYGFDVPTSSDLVKNGATQIALLGQDLDTFLFRPFTKNVIINGGMDIWQRGTSFTSTGATTNFAADRWCIYNGRTGTTYSRQTSGLTGFQYSMRVQRDSGNSATANLYATTTLETADSLRFAGQTVTLSFYAKAGANYSSASSALTAQIIQGTGTDQIVWSFTGSNAFASSSVTLTTSWQRFTLTGTAASTLTEIAALFVNTPVGTAGANDWFEITGVQLEVGNQVSPFIRTGGNIQKELAACQRYYYRTTPGAIYTTFSSGWSTSTTQFLVVTPLPVVMRIAPTALEQTGTAANYSVFQGSTGVTCNGVPVAYHGSNNTMVTSFPVASGLTVGQAGVGRTDNSTAGYLGWSAEL
jgi:hypothetical protein